MKKKDKTKEIKMGCQKKENPITNSLLKSAALNSVPPTPTAGRWLTTAHRGSPMAKNGTKVAQKGARMAQNGSRRLTKISTNPQYHYHKYGFVSFAEFFLSCRSHPKTLLIRITIQPS